MSYGFLRTLPALCCILTLALGGCRDVELPDDDCGDDSIDTGEECDGTDLGGDDCTDHGFTSGELGCEYDCTFDITQCEGPVENCGNDAIDTGEDCDGTELGGEDCTSQGFTGGDLACSDSCAFDTSGCEGGNDCGNGDLDSGEDCDGTNLDGNDCTHHGFVSGDLACSDTCSYDTTGCVADEDCGNGDIDDGEDCDGTNLDGNDCTDHGFGGGDLACTAACLFDMDGCVTGEDCGNGDIDDGEDCDGTNLDGDDCTDHGFASGDLACSDSCDFDTSDCVAGDDCGNGDIDLGEDCDGTNLDGDDCVDHGFASGDLACTAACDFDFTDCVAGDDCGNGDIDFGEDCDGTNLDGDDCTDHGFASGDLACTSACDFDFTDCVAGDDCGNGDIDPGEDCDGSSAPCSGGQVCLSDCTCGVATTCGDIGDPCDSGVVQPAGFACVETAGGHACYESCNPEAAVDTCPGASECLGYDPDDLTAGFCAEDECDSFWSNDCAVGRCVFVTPNVDRCYDIGAGDDYDTCEAHSDCLADAMCLGGWCTTMDCAPISGAATCSDAGDDCGGYYWEADPIDIGVCQTPCTPWVGTECDPDEQCDQNWYIDDEGICGPNRGTAGEGDSCDNMTTATTCDENLTCTGDVGSATCSALCDPSVTTGSGDPGDICSSGEGCMPYTDGVSSLEIGYCFPACDYHGGTACADAAETCSPGEIFATPFDICMELDTTVAAGDVCPAPMVEYDFCAAASVCLDTGDGFVRCIDLCMTSEGAFDTSPHSDCRDASATCTEAFIDVTDYGLCF